MDSVSHVVLLANDKKDSPQRVCTVRLRDPTKSNQIITRTNTTQTTNGSSNNVRKNSRKCRRIAAVGTERAGEIGRAHV